MTRRLAKTGISYLAGLAAASFLSLTLTLAAGAGIASAGLCARFILCSREMYRKACDIAVCTFFFGIGLLVFGAYDIINLRPVQSNDEQLFEGSGRIVMAEHYENSSLYAVRFTLPNGSKGKAAFYLYNSDRLVKGDTVSVKGTLSVPDNSGFFDSGSYLSSQGIFITVENAEMTGCNINEHSLFRKADAFRLSAVSRIRRIMEGTGGGELLTGMLFGRSFWQLSEYDRDMLTNSGISHIASVSGLHMSIAAGIAAAIAGALRFPKLLKFLSVAAAVLVFALCADFSMSVTRSLIMILLVYSAQLVRRRSDPLTSLTAAMLIITAGCPFMIRNTSLLLSASGVLGAAVISPKVIVLIEELANSRRESITRPYKADSLTSLWITCICAYCAVFPVSCLTFDKVSAVSPVINAMLSPLFSGAVTLGIAGVLLTGFLTPLGNISLRAGGLICQLILGVSRAAGSANIAVIPTGNGLMPLFVFLCLAAGAAGLLLTSRKSYGLLAFSAAVFICTGGLSLLRALPDDSIRIAVITEGKGCAVVISDSTSTHVADFSGNRSCARAVKSYIASKGLYAPSEIIAANGKGSAVYGEIFYGLPVLSPENGSYVPGRDIIHGDGIEIIPGDSCTLINTSGISLAVVTGKGPLPPDDYGVLVISAYSGAAYDCAEYYAVARREYSGSLPAGADVTFCETAVYRVKNGAVTHEE